MSIVASFGIANVADSFCGFDCTLVVDYRVTSRGYRGDYYSPPESPEIEIDRITMVIDEPGCSCRSGPAFEATGAQLRHLANREDVARAVFADMENYEHAFDDYD